MRFSYVATTLAIALQVKADWDITFWDCCGMADPFGTPSCWTSRGMATNEQGLLGGCDFGQNPCNCGEQWYMEPHAGDTYAIIAPWGNIGYCVPEGGKSATYNSWGTCLVTKTHRCYSANCGQHRKRSGGASIMGRAEDVSPALTDVQPVARAEADTSVAALPEYLESETSQGTMKWRKVNGKAEVTIGDTVKIIEFETEQPAWVKEKMALDGFKELPAGSQ